MSVISSISARHMETWAHGQAIFDSLGIRRKNEDRILNIVIIGNNTFNWSYKVNKLDIPKQTPYLKLIFSQILKKRYSSLNFYLHKILLHCLNILNFLLFQQIFFYLIPLY